MSDKPAGDAPAVVDYEAFWAEEWARLKEAGSERVLWERLDVALQELAAARRDETAASGFHSRAASQLMQAERHRKHAERVVEEVVYLLGRRVEQRS